MPEPFGPLLKAWRGKRRLSQLDLGLAANVSARHICFLETGRANPSKSMVLQLSETLEVPLSDRNVLLSAAGFSFAYQSRNLEDEDMAHVRAAVDWMLERHDPYPAIALDRHWQIVRANNCASALLGAMGVGEGTSMLDALTEPSPFRDAIENWDEVAQHMVVRLRTESAHLGGDAVLDTAVDALVDALGENRMMIASPLPAIIPARYKAGDAMLSFFSTIAQFGTAEDIALSDLKIEMMFPADDETRRLLTPNQ